MLFSEMVFIYSGALGGFLGVEGLNVMRILIRIGEGGLEKEEEKLLSYSRQCVRYSTFRYLITPFFPVLAKTGLRGSF